MIEKLSAQIAQRIGRLIFEASDLAIASQEIPTHMHNRVEYPSETRRSPSCAKSAGVLERRTRICHSLKPRSIC
jgi:hypothetical protein